VIFIFFFLHIFFLIFAPLLLFSCSFPRRAIKAHCQPTRVILTAVNTGGAATSFRRPSASAGATRRSLLLIIIIATRHVPLASRWRHLEPEPTSGFYLLHTCCWFIPVRPQRFAHFERARCCWCFAACRLPLWRERLFPFSYGRTNTYVLLHVGETAHEAPDVRFSKTSMFN